MSKPTQTVDFCNFYRYYYDIKYWYDKMCIVYLFLIYFYILCCYTSNSIVMPNNLRYNYFYFSRNILFQLPWSTNECAITPTGLNTEMESLNLNPATSTLLCVHTSYTHLGSWKTMVLPTLNGTTKQGNSHINVECFRKSRFKKK